jgi:hypothetical protein
MPAMQIAGNTLVSWVQQFRQQAQDLGAATGLGGQSLPVAGQQSSPDASDPVAAVNTQTPAPAAGGSLLSAFVLANLLGVTPQAQGASAGSSAADSPAAQTATTPAAAPPSGGLLGSSLLGALFAAQQQQDSASDQRATKVIASADSNTDGQLSLSEVTAALTGKNGSAPDATSLAAAFNQLDANGDGQLSQSELATGLQTLASSRHGHHHHHGGGAPVSGSPDPWDTPDAATGSTAATTPTSDSDQTSSTGVATKS